MAETSYSQSAAAASVSATFKKYPADQPFINSEYRRDPLRPVDSYPESNRDGAFGMFWKISLIYAVVSRLTQAQLYAMCCSL